MNLLEKNSLVKEKSFELGLGADEIPKDLNQFDAEYYNLGLKLFHVKQNIHYQSKVIQLATFENYSLWKEEDKFKDFKSIVEFCAQPLFEIDNQYKIYLDFKEEFAGENKLIKILEDKLVIDFSYTVCRNIYVKKILDKKEKFNDSYNNLFNILKNNKK